MSDQNEDLQDMKSVSTLLKNAKSITEDIFGKDVTFNDVITVYTLLKSERLTRVAKDFAKLGRSPATSPIPVGQIGPKSPFGGNGGIS